MVINTNNGFNPGNSASARTKASDVSSPQGDAKSVNQSPAQAKDDVVLSNQAQALSRLESSIADAPSGNSSRVEAIKAALRDGSYTIDPASIAGKMIDQDDLLA
jgi:negative regulator of flagellin synthesis FlgM